MTSEKIRLLAAIAGVAALVATPVFAATIHKGKTSHSDAASDTDVYASQAQRPYDANTVYAAFDNHKNEDFKPHLLNPLPLYPQHYAGFWYCLPEDSEIFCFNVMH